MLQSLVKTIDRVLTSRYYYLVSGMNGCYQSWQFLCEASRAHWEDVCQDGMQPDDFMYPREELYPEYEKAWKACEHLVSVSQDRQYLYDETELSVLFLLDESANMNVCCFRRYVTVALHSEDD